MADLTITAAACLALLCLLAIPASAQVIQGQATVIDGDTLEIHGQRIRLNGIDAPESRQTCRRADGASYRCGQMAALALADFIGRSTVSCSETGRDRYKRVLATCRVRGEDVGAWMVVQGHAMAFRRYSTEYVPQEVEASRVRRGDMARSASAAVGMAGSKRRAGPRHRP